MSPLSPVLRALEGGRVAFWCPGCNHPHSIPVAAGHEPGRWGNDGNAAAPTFIPSILVRSGHYVPGHDGLGCYCTRDKRDQEEFADLKCALCHSIVVGGHIEFLGDCTHELAGSTVPMRPWPGHGGSTVSDSDGDDGA